MSVLPPLSSALIGYSCWWGGGLIQTSRLPGSLPKHKRHGLGI